MRSQLMLGLLLVGLSACTAEPEVRVPPPSKPDKQALFGDPSLVPTREGELIRRELALAGELERMLAAHQLDGRVSVSLPGQTGRTEARVVMVVDAVDGEPLRSELTTLALTIVPELEPAGVHLSFMVRAPAPTEPRGGQSLALTLAAALGLGLALGITFERARTRARPAA